MSALLPPVEPLSDVSWQRVEKGLFAALDCDAAVAAPIAPIARASRWRPWAIAAGVALVAAIVLVLVRPWQTAPEPAVGSASATATAPSRVVTQDAASEISFGEAAITVDAHSALTLSGDADRGVVSVIERGSATFEVAPRDNRPPFLVQAGDVTVRVIGTRFSVSRSGDAARVDVTEGHVEVVARGHRVQVRAGETWSSSDDWEAVGRGQATSQGGIAAAHFPDQNGQPDNGQSGDARSGNGSAHDGLPWEGQSSAGAAVDHHPRPRQRTSRPSDTSAPAAAPTPKLDDRARFTHAAALESSDPRAALAVYRELAKGQGPWAANALFAAGRLAVELEDGDAASFLRAYLQRYPNGANAADARTLLDQLGS